MRRPDWKCDSCGFVWKPRRNWTMKDPVRCKSCGSKAIHEDSAEMLERL